MNNQSRPRKKSPFWLFFLVIVMSGFSLYIILGLQDSNRIYAEVRQELSNSVYSGGVGKIEFPGTTGSLNIPSWEVFRSGQIWSLVSSDTPLPSSFIPDNLVDVAPPHGDNALPMKIQSTINTPLTALLSSAEAAGYPLMLSSAYRSIADQQSLYTAFVETKGQAAADRYVANPGQSEHHTGLAVDLSDISDSCSLNSDRCSLGNDSSAWLATYAHLYGFTIRYPEGKQPITGISYEPWHYRYVGIPLATKLYESELTLDEALTQMHPAFAR
ncbi:M15 family metallopeptidase [Pedobacter sp.]|nr:M15 family metallopeptidase [Candidatus Saccharibacteria bacterium]